MGLGDRPALDSGHLALAPQEPKADGAFARFFSGPTQNPVSPNYLVPEASAS